MTRSHLHLILKAQNWSKFLDWVAYFWDF